MGHRHAGGVDDADATVLTVVGLKAHRPEGDSGNGGREDGATCESLEHFYGSLEGCAPCAA